MFQLSDALKANLYGMITILAWSSSYIGIRYAVTHGLVPETLATLRYFSASLVLIPVYALLKNKKHVPWKDLLKISGLGLIGIALYNIFLCRGEAEAHAATASFFISQVPIVALILYLIMGDKKLSKKHTLAFAISFVGICIIAFSERKAMHLPLHHQFMPLLELGAACFFCASFIVLQKPMLKKYPPVQLAILIIWGATFYLACAYTPQSFHAIQHESYDVLLTAVYLGLVPGAMAYITWAKTLNYLPLPQAVTFHYWAPFITTLLGFLVLDEMPHMLSLLGGVIALAAPITLNRKTKSA